jgi:hypothetical protein
MDEKFRSCRLCHGSLGRGIFFCAALRQFCGRQIGRSILAAAGKQIRKTPATSAAGSALILETSDPTILEPISLLSKTGINREIRAIANSSLGG